MVLYNGFMDNTIVVAIITGVCSVIGQYFISIKKAKESEMHDIQREQKQSDRLDAIEHKLDIHNGYAEKLGDISITMAKMQKDIEFLKKG